MDTLVAEAGSSDYLVNILHDQAKIIQLLKEAIQVLRHRAIWLQQNHAIRLLFLMHITCFFVYISRISGNMKVKNGLDAEMNTLVPEAGSSDYLVNIVHDEAIVIQLLEEIRMLHRATLIKNDSLDNLIDNVLRKSQEMIKITESLGTLPVVGQGLLIQHLEEKTAKMLEKITRMDQILKLIDADHQETLKMLGVAKVHTCGVYTYIHKTALHITLNRFLEILST